jgi:multisubunit Na+/H+ antiporter MnhB subunit
MRDRVIIVILAVIPCLLAGGYVLTQRSVHDAIVRRSEAAIREARERREREARTGIRELPPIAPRESEDLSPLEELEWLVESGLISRDSVERAHLTFNIAPKVVPISFGAAFGLWAAAVIRWTVKRRAHAPVSVSIEPAARAAPTRRVSRLAVVHLLGLALCALGLCGAALVAADLNAYWYRATALPRDVGSDGMVTIGQAVRAGLAPAFAVMAFALGIPLVLRGRRMQPFVRLSRARALPLAVAACGAAWIVFSVASLAMYDARWRNQTLIGGVDPYRPGYFETQIGSAGLTRLGLPLGVGLVMLGVTGSLIAPALLRRRPGFLSGATECVDCAQPLLAGQTTCPECGCGHAPRSTGAAAR